MTQAVTARRHRSTPPPPVYANLPTEQADRRRPALDQLATSDLLRLMNREDATVPHAVARALPEIARAVEAIVESLAAGGRLFLVGAGTSGRLAVLEAAECPPTFGTPPALIQAVIAGGPEAVFRSKEGVEDDAAAGRAAMRAVGERDVVVGIAASGVTRFVRAGLQTSKRRGARTILVTCHPTLPPSAWIDRTIAVALRPELIAGSTRLKAGTATKLVLNMLTVGAMVHLGKVYDQWMVDVRPTSRKLRARALRIIQTVAGVSPARASAALRRTGGRVKPAIVVAVLGVVPSEAEALLARHAGFLRPILEGTR